MKPINGRSLSLMIAGLLATTGVAHGNPPDSTYQTVYNGKLFQNGVPVNSLVDLRVRMYSSVNASSPTKTEIHSGVDVVSGAFTIFLGSESPLGIPLSLLAGNRTNFFVEIDVGASGSGNWTVLLGRQLIQATPFALHALIRDREIDNAKLADGSVNGIKIVDNSVSGIDIRNGTITSSDINANSVQARIGNACDANSAMREISSSGVATCANLYRRPTVSPDYFADRHNSEGTSETPMELYSDSVCFLTWVGVQETDNGGEIAECRIYERGGRWILGAYLRRNEDADVYCHARCMTW